MGGNRLYIKVLNQPPHHLGLWREESLEKIASHFGLTYIGNDSELLQNSQYETYVMHKFYIWFKSDFIIKVLWKLKITKLFKNYLLKDKENVKGHSINACYTKN